MKSRFIPFTILTVASLYAGLATGNNIFYLLFSVFIAVAILSLLTLLVSYLQFNYRQILSPKHGTKGETVELDMQIHNDYPIPYAHVTLEYDLPDDSLNFTTNTKTFAMMPKSVESIKESTDTHSLGSSEFSLLP